MLNSLHTIDLKLKQTLDRIGNQIGNTPLLPIKNLFKKQGVTLYVKAEWLQLSGSVKARAAFKIIKDALENYQLQNKTLLDASSGNTGIAYAQIGALLNIPVTICLPENASTDRKEILKSFNANIIYTSKYGGTDDAQLYARDLVSKFPERYFYADQYKNQNNLLAHYHGTGVEIINSLPGITHYVCGLGTGGSFSGTGLRLKKHNENIQLVALQPDNALHGIEGWKHMETAIIPEIYRAELVDRTYEIDTLEAYEMIKKVKATEGFSLSPSSAANLLGAIKLATEIERGLIVCMLPDNADRYGEVNSKLLSQ